MCSPDISHEKNPRITSVCIVKGRLGENIATVSKSSEAFTPLWGFSVEIAQRKHTHPEEGL